MKLLSVVWATLASFVCAFPNFLGFFAYMCVGGTPMTVTPGPAAVFAVATALLIQSDLTVCRLCASRDAWIDAIGAMRVTVPARASTIAGSTFVDIPISVITVSLTQLEASATIANAITSGFSNLVGPIWTVVALVVKRWCVTNSGDNGSSSSYKRNTAA